MLSEYCYSYIHIYLNLPIYTYISIAVNRVETGDDDVSLDRITTYGLRKTILHIKKCESAKKA